MTDLQSIDADSINYYLKRLKNNQEDVEALYELGRIAMEVGRSAEASNFLARAVVLEPWHKAARELLDRIEAERRHQPLDDLVDKARGILSKRSPQDAGSGDSGKSCINSAPEYYACARPEIQRLVRQDARHILDIGCATGVLGQELKQKLRAEVWGVECVEAVAEAAAEKLDHVISGRIEDALTQLPDNYFYVISCADVLEHLVDPWEVLSDLRKKLAPSGEIVASIPNVRHWSVIKGLLEGEWRYEVAGILDRTHLRFFTKNSVMNLFENTGYTVIIGKAVTLEGDDSVPEAVLSSLKQAGLIVETLLEESRHYQYLLVARPAEPAIQAPARSRCPSCSPITSIVMLTWNQLSFTQACLASIAIHTPEPYELIIVDNGSSDGTQDWLKQQAAQDCRIKIILKIGRAHV